MTCTATHVTTQADVNAGSIHNTATATGTPPPGLVPPVDQAVEDVPGVRRAAIEITKVASPQTFSATGQTITYTYRVTNTGNVTLANVHFTDTTIAGPFSCAPAMGATLAPGAVMTCTATHVTTLTDVNAGSIANTATATGTPPAGLTPPVAKADEEVHGTASPAIEITKTASPQTYSAPGQTITYTYTVTNTGPQTLTNVQLTDTTIAGPFTCTPALGSTLLPGAVMTCTATHLTTQGDVDAGSIANTATATGTPPSGPPVTDDASETVFPDLVSAIEVVKAASPQTYNAPGQTITYTYTVTNTGNVTLTNVQLTDTTIAGPFICTPALGSTLLPGAVMTCTATHLTTQGDVDAGKIANTGTATGTPPTGPPVTDDDVETVFPALTPAIEITKTASPQSYSRPGQTITYTYTVTNTGNMSLHNVRLTDTRIAGPFTCTPAMGSTLAPGAVMTCTAHHVTTQADVDAGKIANVATATGHPVTGGPVTDEADETVFPDLDTSIEITKTASPQTYSRPGQTITYTYTVTNTGTVTLRNVTVTDSRFGTITCPRRTLAPGASMTCSRTHVTTQADVDAGKIANTGTATGHPPTGGPVTDDSIETVFPGLAPAIEITKSASPLTYNRHGQTITYTYTVVNTGNTTLHNITVTDNRFGTIACPARTLAPGQSMSCTHTHPISAIDLDAGHIANIARATGTPPVGGPLTSLPARALVTLSLIAPPTVPVTG
jgi:uncharacterized repeat protein (TIGR01451 family)